MVKVVVLQVFHFSSCFSTSNAGVVSLGCHQALFTHIFHRWASPFSPFSPFANRYHLFVSLSRNGQMTNFRFHDEQTVNGLRKIVWASVFCFPFEMAAYK
jgi:hypothetical protein